MILETLVDVAGQVGVDPIATEAADLRERLAEGRFFVVCVGQFKRGKSTLLNALVGSDVLPIGVVPVTAIVTVLRYGAEPRARVRFRAGDWTPMEVRDLRQYVTETENPENRKGVAAVEVFVPSEQLRSGLCLVDTPGLGSVFAGNTEATREFIPQIDAALVVIGADPPISGAELDLIEEVAKQIQHVVVVLNKADKLTMEEREEGRAFAENVLRQRLGREVGPILEVSAVERATGGTTRDWARLEEKLQSLARTSHEVVREARERGVRRLASRLVREIDEHRDALVRPHEESARRVAALQRSVAEAERTLSELDYLFKAVQDGLARTFEKERESFLGRALPVSVGVLDRRIDEAAAAKDLAALATEIAQIVARGSVDEWRREVAPVAEQLYAKAVGRFVEIANDFLRRVADPRDPALAALPESFDPVLGFRTKPRFYFTDLLAVASPSLGARLGGITRAGRLAAAKKDSKEYIERLLSTNSARVVNDFSEQVLESRRMVQAELREHLRAVVRSAENAVARTAARRAEGEAAVEREVERYRGLRARVIDHVGNASCPVVVVRSPKPEEP
jgi:predicted GTPase